MHLSAPQAVHLKAFMSIKPNLQANRDSGRSEKRLQKELNGRCGWYGWYLLNTVYLVHGIHRRKGGKECVL